MSDFNVMLVYSNANDSALIFIKGHRLSPTLLALCLLIISNCFMTMAWYGHLKILHDAPLWQAILFSWCIACWNIVL
jgi:uncharacterized protein (DUF486 family)